MYRRSTVATFLVAVYLAVALYASASPASAHKPIYDSGGSTMDTAMVIPDAAVSYAIFAQYDPDQPQIQFYEFPVEQGQLFNFQLGVPAIDGLEDFAPIAILIGPGLSSPDELTSDVLEEFGLSLQAGDGALSWAYSGAENVEEFEAFTQVVFWERQEAELDLPETGTYYLAVAVSANSGSSLAAGEGKYMLAPGKAEEFGVADYVLIPVDWVYSQQFWENNLYLMMLPTAITVVLGILLVFVLSRQGKLLKDTMPLVRAVAYAGIVGALLIIGSGVNQILLLFGSGHFFESSLNSIVLMIQSAAVILGLLAFRQGLMLTKKVSKTSMVLPVLITVLALLAGAGWIIGPILFLSASAAEVILDWRAK